MRKISYLTACIFFVSYSLLAQVANGPITHTITDGFVVTDADPCDGYTSFDLNVLDQQILGGQNPSSYIVSYHLTQMDADFNLYPLQSPFVNYTNPQVIFGRVTESSTSNYDITDITLIVEYEGLQNISLSGDFFICNNGNLSTVIDTGLDNNSYLFDWSYNGALLPAETLSSITIDQAGNYEVLITNASTGCSIVLFFLIDEIDCSDTDSDGVIDYNEDLNLNGNFDDDDTDLDNIPNYLDDDDDGDGVLTINEDYNNNGDPRDDDTDNSGIADYLEMSVALSVETHDFKSLKVYPNPSNNIVYIDNLSTTSSVSIYDIRGRKVDINIKESTMTKLKIDVSEMKSGVYILKVKNGLTQKDIKLLVDH